VVLKGTIMVVMWGDIIMVVEMGEVMPAVAVALVAALWAS